MWNQIDFETQWPGVYWTSYVKAFYQYTPLCTVWAPVTCSQKQPSDTDVNLTFGFIFLFFICVCVCVFSFIFIIWRLITLQYCSFISFLEIMWVAHAFATSATLIYASGFFCLLYLQMKLIDLRWDSHMLQSFKEISVALCERPLHFVWKWHNSFDKIMVLGDPPGCPVVKTQSFQFKGCMFDTWSGN